MDRLRGQRYLVVVVVGNYWFAALDLRDWLPSRHAPQGSLLPSNPYRPQVPAQAYHIGHAPPSSASTSGRTTSSPAGPTAAVAEGPPGTA